LRALVESGVGLIPVLGPLTRLYQTTHPSQFQKDVEQWQGDVTASINNLKRRLEALEATFSPKLVLSDQAVEIALWIVGEDEHAHGYPVGMDQILSAFPVADVRGVEEAVHELADAGLVEVTPVIGPGGARVKAEWPLFWLFEPLATGISPLKDAAEIARWAIGEEHLSAQEVQEEYGWPPRRINAAMELIATFAPPAHVSRPANPAFTVWSLHIDAGTRRKLRQFLGAPHQSAPT